MIRNSIVKKKTESQDQRIISCTLPTMSMSPTVIFSSMSVGVVLGVAILLLVLWMCIRKVRETEESFMQQSNMESSKIDNFLVCVFAVSVIFDIFLRRVV